MRFGSATWRSAVPDGVAGDPQLQVGPRLFEQTDYAIMLRSLTGETVSLRHRDVSLLRDVRQSANGTIVHGVLNFGSQLGRSDFSVVVGGQREFDFEIEVFSTKLDYLTDYQQLLAEVQDILTGLVLEYLRSTFQLGTAVHQPQPTHLEWLTLLRHVLGDLERALQNVAKQPVRSTKRVTELIRAERLKKVDSQVRRQVLRGGGRGQSTATSSGITVRQHLLGTTARPTLDTPEHRWLAGQLEGIRNHVVQLRSQHESQEPSTRHHAIQNELHSFEMRLSELLRLEPMSEVTGAAPPGFASMQLLGSPGYREAYKCCIILRLGLRLGGGPIHLSVKDLSLLYEYWCYLALLKTVAGLIGQEVPAKELLAVEQNGLRVQLKKGVERKVAFNMSGARRIEVTYNPRFSGGALLTAQQPDMVVCIVDRDWPKVRLVLDAKYRLDNSSEYVARYRSPGPPDDAINVLHRYRDAILDASAGSPQDNSLKRTVVQGLALFPFREDQPGVFRKSRLWEAIHRLGVGAIPTLPGGTQYLREWLAETLARGGWNIAQKAIPHRSNEHAADWRIAASEAVLVGVLRPENAQQHFDWIRESRQYYVPLTAQPRQYSVRHVAIYLPTALRQPGAVAWWASVTGIEVVSRSQIRTPWGSRRGNGQQVLYRLGPLRPLERPVENRSTAARWSGPRTWRWTSRLALLRASNLQELLLETEPEWRLVEDLRAAGIKFEIQPGEVQLLDPEDPRGRARFVVGDARVQYRGAAGFVIQEDAVGERCIVDTVDVLAILQRRLGLDGTLR